MANPRPNNNMSLAVSRELNAVECRINETLKKEETRGCLEHRASLMHHRDALKKAHEHLLAFEQEEQRKWREANPEPTSYVSW